jgi:hypothetical protein
MAAPDADAEALAADIICSLRGADLAGWTPPWCKPAPSPAPHAVGELIWPAVVRGKRSRRSSPSAGTASGKGRWGRGSPASPLDYSGGSGSGASTSGGEDGGFCWPPATNKVRHRPCLPTRAYTSSLSLSLSSSSCHRHRLCFGSFSHLPHHRHFFLLFLRFSGRRDETALSGQRKSLPFVAQSRITFLCPLESAALTPPLGFPVLLADGVKPSRPAPFGFRDPHSSPSTYVSKHLRTPRRFCNVIKAS